MLKASLDHEARAPHAFARGGARVSVPAAQTNRRTGKNE